MSEEQEEFTVGRTAFAMIPAWVISGVNADALRVYAHLACTYANSDRTCHPGQKTIAADLDMGLRTVERAIADLKSIRAIIVVRRDRRDGKLGRNHYWLPMDYPPAQADGERSPDQQKKNVSAGRNQPPTQADDLPAPAGGSTNQTHKENQKRLAPGGAATNDEDRKDAEDGSLPGMPSPPPQPDSAATVVAAFVDAYTAVKHLPPPRSTVGKIASTAKRMLGGGADPETLLASATSLAATQWTNLEAQYERTLTDRAKGGPSSAPDLRSWLNDVWKRGAARELADATGMTYYGPARWPEEDLSGEARKAYVVADWQRWVTDHKDEILTRLTRKAATS